MCCLFTCIHSKKEKIIVIVIEFLPRQFYLVFFFIDFFSVGFLFQFFFFLLILVFIRDWTYSPTMFIYISPLFAYIFLYRCMYVCLFVHSFRMFAKRKIRSKIIHEQYRIHISMALHFVFKICVFFFCVTENADQLDLAVRFEYILIELVNFSALKRKKCGCGKCPIKMYVFLKRLC